jgi:sigma-B regulation protein RsbQ
MDLVERHHITEFGRPDGPPMVFAHGFGCDQRMWQAVVPAFADRFRVVLFDWIGFGRSDASSYDFGRYSSLDGYASDLLAICEQLGLDDVVFVGHSVASMIGVLAAVREPARFDKLVLVGPSPRYIDDDDYVGGFRDADIDDLLDSLADNYLGWSRAMAPVIMGNGDRPELADELEAAFCRADPQIAEQFAAVTFRSDNRAELGDVRVPTLVLQCTDDAIAPDAVGEFVHAAITGSTLVHLEATGHCPNISAPEETAAAIAAFVG